MGTTFTINSCMPANLCTLLADTDQAVEKIVDATGGEGDRVCEVADLPVKFLNLKCHFGFRVSRNEKVTHGQYERYADTAALVRTVLSTPAVHVPLLQEHAFKDGHRGQQPNVHINTSKTFKSLIK